MAGKSQRERRKKIRKEFCCLRNKKRNPFSFLYLSIKERKEINKKMREERKK